MEKHILFFDIDGTIFFDCKTFPYFVKKFIKKAQKKGNYIVINTGRDRTDIPKELTEDVNWDGFCCNGAYIEFHNQVICDKKYSKEELAGILSVVDKYHLKTTLLGNREFHLNEFDSKTTSQEILEHYEEYNIKKIATSGLSAEESIDELRKFASVFDMGPYLDVFVKGYGKGTCVKELCKHLNIPTANAIAFGDNTNDLDMFKSAGKSVAMKFSPKELKEIATLTAKTKRHGACEGIYKILLKK